MKALLLLASLAFFANADASIYAVPAVYEASLTFQLPYFNFSEDWYIWSDSRNGGAMRIQLYGGSNTYVYSNRSAVSSIWSVVPVERALACTQTPLDAFKNPFPDLSLFVRRNDTNGDAVITNIRGISSTVWDYVFQDPQVHGGSTFNPPKDDEGYVGTYVWYQRADNGAPVRFHTVVGHGVALGGSHVDEYIVDYHTTLAADSFPDSFFNAPAGMPCVDGISPFGPTRAKLHHLDNFGLHTGPGVDAALAMPDGHATRRSLADSHAIALHDHHGKSGLVDRHATKTVTHLASSAKYIAARNRWLAATGKKYRLGLNGLSHMSHEARRKMAGFRAMPAMKVSDVTSTSGDWPLGPGLPPDSCSIHQLTGKSIPDNIDLRDRNLVLPPKDQGQCGSCWSYGATGAIEGALAFARNDGQLPVALSQQQLMDCSWRYGNNACNGGTDFNGFSWLIQKNRGLIAEAASYGEYLQHDGFCHYDISNKWTNTSSGVPVKPGARIVACVHINDQFNLTTPSVPPQVATNALNDVLANVGVPVSVAIQATLPDFYYYTGGLYEDAACHNDTASLDHQVLAVGYKTVDGQRFTLIRNSWSTHWGEGGYVNLAQRDNDCGVATSATYTIAQAP